MNNEVSANQTKQNFKIGDKVIVKSKYCYLYRITNDNMKVAEIIGIETHMVYGSDIFGTQLYEDYAKIKILEHKNKTYIGYTAFIPLEQLALEKSSLSSKLSNEATETQEKSVINIRPTGNKVTAIMSRDGNIVSSASAICCPTDKFDYKLGTIIAFSRLFGEEKFFDAVKTYYKEWIDKQKTEKLRKDFTTAVVNAIDTPVKKIEKPTLYMRVKCNCFSNPSIYDKEVKVGCVGDITNLRDINGEKLHIGDVVDVYDRELNLFIKNAIVFYGDTSHINKISGIGGYCQPNGNISHYRIVKRSSISDMNVVKPEYTNPSTASYGYWFEKR